jgi:ATP-dependent Zn protease
VDEEIRTLVMRGHETARQIIERQRAAVKALAEDLLQEESVDADRLREILAASVVPATSFPPAVRDALIEARLQA